MFGRLLPIALVLVCATLQAAALAARHGEPSSDGLRRFTLGEIAESLTAGQTMELRADGLTSVTIHPRAIGGDLAGTATIEFRDITREPAVVVTRMTQPVRDIVDAGAVTIEFPAQNSRGRQYELELRVEGVARGQGFGLLATRGGGYRDGRMRVIGRNRFGDLVFETRVIGARSNFAELASRLSAAGVPGASALLVLALLVVNGALLVVLRATIPPIGDSVDV